MSVDIKIEPVWSEEPFIVPNPGGGKTTKVAQEMATQVIPSIKMEEPDPLTDGDVDIVPDCKTEKSTPTKKQDPEMFHSASEALPDIKIPENEGDSGLTQSSLETVWIKQEAKDEDEDEMMYDESNDDGGHHTLPLTDNIWDADTTGSAECGEISGLDNKQDKDDMALPIYKLDSKVEDLNILTCQPDFPSKSDLPKRISQTTRAKSYVCNVCQKSFFRRAFLSRHMEGHKEDPLFSCDMCGKQVKSKEALKRHIYAQHTDEVMDSTPRVATHACNVCMKSFYRSYHLKRHMLVHSDERPYSCEICPKRFKDQHQIKAHYNIHAAQRTDEGKQPKSDEFLNNHHLSTPENNGVFSRKIFISNQKRSHPCYKCTKSFDRLSRLKKHLSLHTD